MRTALPILVVAAFALAACSDQPQMVAADAPPPAATAAVTELVDAGSSRSTVTAPPSTLSDF